MRVAAPVAVVLALWLTLGGMPQLPSVLHAAGYYPTRTQTGLANHVAFGRLVR
jgi:hypothetical protein